MSEYVEDVLDGLRCQCCGTWIDDWLATAEGETALKAPGFPRTCRECSGAALRQQTKRARRA